ncbi:MAG TPA: hypothetical protein PKL16_01885 [Anaerolineae bacterium]|nr:MAG: hypothetical protein BWY25_01736 [Chloroflexi bacterium ADurb.Bin222]HOC20237.1 hypothetical protein [Anaerolineae bacterium]HQJ10362.1 hypothetical protein [Anaerolineae bacterium]HQM14842.1 hypothetical protein [Anaerolineae bacterium]HUM35411.1 hypothetical protein [Anaerolineae bacterium]
MIKVRRGPQPEGFHERAISWQTRFEQERESNPSLTITRFWDRIRNEIRADAEHLYHVSHGKCAFCESYMADVSTPHIEHYRPKSKFPELAFVWDNWLLSCQCCNGKKWGHFPICEDLPCLIDPGNEDPEMHITFEGYTPISKTPRGEKTIELLGLRRSPLEDERSRWLNYVSILLLSWCNTKDSMLKDEIRELLIWAMQDEAPYAAMTRCFLQKYAPRLASKAHPPVTCPRPLMRIQELVEQWSHEFVGLE